MTGRDGPGRGEQLAILTPGTPAQPRDTAAELRLVTWNVQHAAPSRARRQAAWLAGQPEADVVVLTEVKDAPGGDALVQALGEHGYHAVVPTRAGGDYMSVVAARTSSSPAGTAGSSGPAATSTSPARPGSVTTPPWP